MFRIVRDLRLLPPPTVANVIPETQLKGVHFHKSSRGPRVSLHCNISPRFTLVRLSRIIMTHNSP